MSLFTPLAKAGVKAAKKYKKARGETMDRAEAKAIRDSAKKTKKKKVWKSKAKKPDLIKSGKAKAMVGTFSEKRTGVEPPPQRKASVAKKMNVSRTDIEQAKTKRELDTYENKVNAMKPGNIKTMLKKIIRFKRKKFERMQANEKDMAIVKSANAARSKKMRGKVTVAPDMKFNRGGMTMRKGNMAYSKGGAAKKR
tara:strand:+ start:2549 stop:3136 length:588 start_codon:yes stop_codon:yes gene_type:complete